MEVFQKMGISYENALRKEGTQYVLLTKRILGRVTATSLYVILSVIKSHISILYLL